MIKRYWFQFSKSDSEFLPIGVSSGCGLSAYNYEDAIELIKERVFSGANLPTIDDVVEEIDISTLDEAHVIPNMGDVTVRGIWFPLGY